ncbi:MAG: PD-(D/E)XK nuclease family protein [Thermoguttaceae bacterium]
MSAHVTILCGPARSGKTERLLSRYRETLRSGKPGSSLWLAPNWRVAAEVRDRLLDGSLAGCFAPGVMTFAQYAQSVLHAARVPIRSITPLMKRELIRQLIAAQLSAGRLKHFQAIARMPGLVDLICEFISELKRLEIWPEEFRQACQNRGGLADKDRELAEIYDAYQQALLEHGLFDAEGRFWSARDALQKEGKREAGREEREGDRLPTEDCVPSRPVEKEPRRSPSPLSPLPSPLPCPLPSPLLVVADGFTDFTRTQHEIIDALASRAAEVFISLPLEPEPRRADLFAKPLATLDQLKRRHLHAVIEELARPADADWPAMSHLERTLFENPRKKGDRGEGRGEREEDRDNRGMLPSSPAAPLPSPLSPLPSPAPPPIEILAAARQLGEIEMIATRVKRLLIDGGARPGDIAVVFRSPQQVGTLVEEVFERLGIPATFESGQTLDRAPALRALAAILQLDIDNWPFDRLLAVLGSNYFQPDWPEWRAINVAAVDRSIRKLQVPSGRQRLLDQLAESIKPGAAVESASATDGGSAGVAERQATLAVVTRLAAVLDALPQRATLPEWARAWSQLAKETGLLRAMDVASTDSSPLGHNGRQSEADAADRRAWDRLMETLTTGDQLAEWLRQRSPELDRRAALDAFLDILATDRLGHSGDESGLVRVLGADSIRSLHIPYLFVAGLSEKVFPPPDREDRLYSEAESARLIEAGLPLVGRRERTREEMLLFYEAVTRATKRLWLSYPALDEAAQPLLPSPFLSEVEQGFGPDKIPRIEQKDLSPIPVDDEPLCQSDFRVRAVSTALAGNVSLLAGLLAANRGQQALSHAAAENLLPGLELIYLRQDRERFSPAEGVFEDEASQRRLRDQFGSEHTFSATELERYASCPFRFLVERVLKIEPIEDLGLELDALERGQIVHEALSKFHRSVNQRLGRPASPLELEAAEYDVLLDAAIKQSLPESSRNSLLGALREINRRMLVEWLAKYRSQLEAYDAQWKDFEGPLTPDLFEVSFGREDEPAPSTDQPFEIPFIEEASDRFGEPERHLPAEIVRLAGRIDRIDVGRVAGRHVFNIVDYKTGGPITITPETVRTGTTLQLPVYALAAMELLLADRDALPWRAGYWQLRDGGFSVKKALRMYSHLDGRIELESDWEEIRDSLADTVLGLAAGIRGGRFPVCSLDDHCTSYCPYRTICRINQVRSLEKTCQPGEAEDASPREESSRNKLP